MKAAELGAAVVGRRNQLRLGQEELAETVDKILAVLDALGLELDLRIQRR